MTRLYLPELREMLREHNTAELREFCSALHPARTVDFMEGLTAEETWEVLQHADAGIRPELFGFLEHDLQVEIIEHHDPDAIAGLIERLSPDDRVDVLSGVEDSIVATLLQRLPADERQDILRLQSYPEGTAGAAMTTDIAKLSADLTIRQTFDELGRLAEQLETIYYLYVVDDQDHLLGVVSARQLVSGMRHPQTKLGELMETNVEACSPHAALDQVVHQVAKFDLLAIPVVDEQRRLLGIITHDDVIDVVVEEAAEDAYRAAAVHPLESSYLKTSLLTLGWKRGMWLVILFFAALLTAFAINRFQGELERAAWLVLYIPLVISSGGNTGSQSATLIITALKTGDIRRSDWTRILRRELVMGLLLGGFLGSVGYLAALFKVPPIEALVIPLTLVLVVMVGTLTGAMLPLLFHRLGLDPAMMSNPFVSVIIDIVGIVIYLNVALAML